MHILTFFISKFQFIIVTLCLNKMEDGRHYEDIRRQKDIKI